MENRKIKSRCIFLHQGKILLCHNKEHDYYFFPGGSGNEGEAPEDTLRREILEEFGTSIENINILTILKNVGKDSEETIAMFKASFSNTAIYEQTEIPLIDLPETKAVWVALSDIESGAAKILPEYDYLKLLEE